MNRRRRIWLAALYGAFMGGSGGFALTAVAVPPQMRGHGWVNRPWWLILPLVGTCVVLGAVIGASLMATDNWPE